MKISKNNKGFTLVELIIVIAIIAILAVVIAPQYLKYVENSRISTDENTLGEIAHAAEIAAIGNGTQSLGDGKLIVTINSENGSFTYSNGTDANAADYKSEVEKTIAEGSYTFKSNMYKNGTGADASYAQTIEITITNGVAQWADAKNVVHGATVTTPDGTNPTGNT